MSNSTGSRQQPGGFFGVVGEDDAGAGAVDALQGFHHDAVAVDPVVLGGGFDHRVFAGDLIGGQRQIETQAGGGDYVEVGQGRLDHDHVSALFDVELDFAHGFAQVGSIHLIGAAVAELRGGVGGLAERAVESRGELGGVRKNRRVNEAGFVEGAADGGDAAIHHVGGGDDVDSGAG